MRNNNASYSKNKRTLVHAWNQLFSSPQLNGNLILKMLNATVKAMNELHQKTIHVPMLSTTLLSYISKIASLLFASLLMWLCANLNFHEYINNTWVSLHDQSNCMDSLCCNFSCFFSVTVANVLIFQLQL